VCRAEGRRRDGGRVEPVVVCETRVISVDPALRCKGQVLVGWAGNLDGVGVLIIIDEAMGYEVIS
jgi:hypothetical protein